MAFIKDSDSILITATLTEKGYFQGTEEGSDEYNQRLQKAKDRLIAEEEKALEARKEQAEIKKAEGNTFLRESKIQEAISSYSEAIKLYPKNAIYYANRLDIINRIILGILMTF